MRSWMSYNLAYKFIYKLHLLAKFQLYNLNGFWQQIKIPKGSAVTLLRGRVTCGDSIFLSEGQKNSIAQDCVIPEVEGATQYFRWEYL